MSAELAVAVRYVGFAGSFALHFGDGTSVLASGNRNYPRAFEQPGAYTVVARATGGGGILATATAIIRAGGAADCMAWGPSPDNPEIWQATFKAVEPTDVPPLLDIDWGDGQVDKRVWAIPGNVLEHPLPAGEHTVTVHDLHTDRVQETIQTVTGPEYDPDFTIAETPGHDPRDTATITVTKVVEGKPLRVDFGEGAGKGIFDVDSAKPNDTWEYSYPADGDKFPTVTYQDGSGTPNDQGFVQIPFTG